MPAFQFSSQGIDPQYGGGSPQLPIGKHPVVISATALKPTKDGQGGYLEITMDAIDGPAKGGQQIDRLNLQNKNADTVRIANQQLAAYCAVTGVFAFNATEELHGKPFVIDVAPEGGDRPNQHKVKALFDINGNPPGQAGAGAAPGGQGQGQGQGFQPPPQQPPQQPPAGDQQQGGQGWAGGNAGGNGQQQGGGWNQGGGGAAAASAPGWGQRQ